ncbi:hypothetical protein ACFTWF_34480 [Rhodococcus sp. NPDC056960]|uniref:hypothetical protein n=1 Tax=Rhodococcus sp. NPDC056960 TaxID=3345982 RepID=UPI003631FD44
MDHYNHAIEEFHQQWEPYGGPTPDDVFIEFGLTINQFYARHRALTRGRRRRDTPRSDTATQVATERGAPDA